MNEPQDNSAQETPNALTKLFQELDRITPRPLSHEDFSAAADAHYAPKIAELHAQLTALRSELAAMTAERDELKATVKKQDREYVLNGSVQEWKDYADRTTKLIADLRSQLAAMTEERDKLKAFKDYVHKRLDEAGVPVDPESPHKAAGCRIGGRLDCVDELRSQVDRLKEGVREIEEIMDTAGSGSMALEAIDAHCRKLLADKQ